MFRLDLPHHRHEPARAVVHGSRIVRPHWHHAIVVAGVVCTMFAGCTDVSRSSLESVRLAWRGQPKLSPTAEQVMAKPFFQMRATTNQGDAILNLGNVDGQRQLWYGKDGVIVVLEHGRVTQTVGLIQNLDGSRVRSPEDPFAIGLHKLDAPTSYDREDDWSPGYRYGIPMHSQLSPSGNTDIDILGTSHHVLLVTEDVSAPAVDYRITNRYWVDPQDGFIWKSEQQVAPGLTLKLVQLRPYRSTTP